MNKNLLRRGLGFIIVLLLSVTLTPDHSSADKGELCTAALAPETVSPPELFPDHARIAQLVPRSLRRWLPRQVARWMPELYGAKSAKALVETLLARRETVGLRYRAEEDLFGDGGLFEALNHSEVPQVTVELGDGEEKQNYRLVFLPIKAYRGEFAIYLLHVETKTAYLVESAAANIALTSWLLESDAAKQAGPVPLPLTRMTHQNTILAIWDHPDFEWPLYRASNHPSFHGLTKALETIESRPRDLRIDHAEATRLTTTWLRHWDTRIEIEVGLHAAWQLRSELDRIVDVELLLTAGLILGYPNGGAETAEVYKRFEKLTRSRELAYVLVIAKAIEAKRRFPENLDAGAAVFFREENDFEAELAAFLEEAQLKVAQPEDLPFVVWKCVDWGQLNTEKLDLAAFTVGEVKAMYLGDFPTAREVITHGLFLPEGAEGLLLDDPLGELTANAEWKRTALNFVVRRRAAGDDGPYHARDVLLQLRDELIEKTAISPDSLEGEAHLALLADAALAAGLSSGQVASVYREARSRTYDFPIRDSELVPLVHAVIMNTAEPNAGVPAWRYEISRLSGLVSVRLRGIYHGVYRTDGETP